MARLDFVEMGIGVGMLDLFGDYESTYIYRFAYDMDNNYALVLHCTEEDGYDTLTNKVVGKVNVIYGKIACQPKNSMMQEYDIDWIMPEIDGEVYDSEYDIPAYASLSRIETTIKDWEKDAEYIIDKLNLEV